MYEEVAHKSQTPISFMLQPGVLEVHVQGILRLVH